MKNKTLHIFGKSKDGFDDRKVQTTTDEAFLKRLRTVKRLSDDKYEEQKGELDTTFPLYATFEAARLSDQFETRNGVTKILSEEAIIFISEDLNKAKIAFANWHTNYECL